MAGYQNSTKLYTESSTLINTTSSPLYSQSLHPTTPLSPAPSLSNSSNTNNTTTNSTNDAATTATSNNNNSPSSNSPKHYSASNSASTTPVTNSNSSAVSRSLSTSSQNPPPHSSAFSPYQNSPQHPTPVATPTTIPKNPLAQPEQTMMASHLDTSGSTTLGYPPHTHYPNPATPYWPYPVGGANGTNGVTVATLPNTAGGSAFMPTVSYGAAASGALTQHSPRPKLTTTIWEDEGTLCYQVDARGICVARRQDNDMINGTKLLNVVGMSRGKRDGILKNEKGRVVVKVGAMHLKGVWIPFQRAKALAAQFKISDLLYPLYVDDPTVFLHGSFNSPMAARIPSMGPAGATSQWRPHYANAFSNTTYDNAARPWYPPYSNGVGNMMGPTPASQGQLNALMAHPLTIGSMDRCFNMVASYAVPHSTVAYTSSLPGSRNQAHPSQHIEEYDGGYNLISGQSSNGQQGVVVSNANNFQGRPPHYEGSPGSQQPRTPTTSVYPNVKTEENSGTNGGSQNYFRPQQNLYSLVNAATEVGGTNPQSASPQMIGQKRGFEADDNDEYGANQQGPMHPQPLTAGIAVGVAQNSFSGPVGVSPQASPSSSAFSGWNNHSNGKRVKYEYPEANTPTSAQSSPRANYQLPGLATGPSTPGSATTPQGYSNSSLQMVTSAQASPHQYSSAAASNNGPATGTTTPTTEGLDRYFQDGAVLHSPSPDNSGTPADENGRRYEQYRQREESTGEELNGGWE